eukprot:scaffold7574_cov277-Pinguiococcus_pyrenoidosus.AAC.2
MAVCSSAEPSHVQTGSAGFLEKGWSIKSCRQVSRLKFRLQGRSSGRRGELPPPNPLSSQGSMPEQSPAAVPMEAAPERCEAPAAHSKAPSPSSAASDKSQVTARNAPEPHVNVHLAVDSEAPLSLVDLAQRHYRRQVSLQEKALRAGQRPLQLECLRNLRRASEVYGTAKPFPKSHFASDLRCHLRCKEDGACRADILRCIAECQSTPARNSLRGPGTFSDSFSKKHLSPCKTLLLAKPGKLAGLRCLSSVLELAFHSLQQVIHSANKLEGQDFASTGHQAHSSTPTKRCKVDGDAIVSDDHTPTLLLATESWKVSSFSNLAHRRRDVPLSTPASSDTSG